MDADIFGLIINSPDMMVLKKLWLWSDLHFNMADRVMLGMCPMETRMYRLLALTYTNIAR